MKSRDTPAAVYPLVSIIMPIRNEGDFMRKSLGAVIAQDYPHERMEVLVADGMSGRETHNVIEELKRATDIRISVLSNAEMIVSTGLNLALAHARGEVIVRVDGHCEIATDYVSNCVRKLAEHKVDGVGGPIETVGGSYISDTVAIAMSSAFGVGGSAFRTVKNREMLADSVPFPAYTREALERAGPFDEELVRNQDDEYNYRLRKLGGKLLLSPDISSRYYSRSTLPGLWRQYFQYGFWKVRVLQKHPRQMSLRQFAPPAFTSTLLLAAILSLFNTRARRLLAFLTATYTAASVVATLRLARSAGLRRLPLLPLVFAILHLSYGSGFLVGLVRFARRWGDDGTRATHPRAAQPQATGDGNAPG